MSNKHVDEGVECVDETTQIIEEEGADDLYKSDIKTILDLWRMHMDDASYEKVLLFLIDQSKKRLEVLDCR